MVSKYALSIQGGVLSNYSRLSFPSCSFISLPIEEPLTQLGLVNSIMKKIPDPLFAYIMQRSANIIQ